MPDSARTLPRPGLPRGQTECKITVVLPPDQALALAQFLKRLTYSAILECAVDQVEADLMRSAMYRVQRELGDEGYAPR